MAFRVEFSALAANKFRKLERPTRNRITAKLRDVADDPARHLTKLRSVDAFRLRVGDHRVILDVDWEGRVLYVLTLGHRSTVYR
ncbi:MAG TPA: type II toxin-antitoxin system RelE/ParE family toxin [Thermoplasmata archaeon]|nr:type II toxin-antitoxin system RelE/ParE family toxin [Thermoplasmata archaeon]